MQFFLYWYSLGDKFIFFIFRMLKCSESLLPIDSKLYGIMMAIFFELKYITFFNNLTMDSYATKELTCSSNL